MCGIAGIIDFNPPGPDPAILHRMIGLMHHRGPDAAGIYLNGPVGLAHARLSIVDLSGGDQPIEDETSFLENGIIDSTGILELVTYLEDTFGIEVEDEELVPENLDSIANVVQYLASKQEMAA
jgi:acyl carrier protein